MKILIRALHLTAFMAATGAILLIAGTASVLAQPAASSHNTVDAATAHLAANAAFTSRTGIAQGKMVFIGKGGAIEGKINTGSSTCCPIVRRQRSPPD
jgi:nitrite reductase (NO-forming)